MADAFSLAGDPSVITTQDFELAPLSVAGSAIVPSPAGRQPRTQNVSPTRKPRGSSPPTHPRFGVSLGEHPLSTVLDAPLFRDLSVSELREISDAGQERTFAHNESLFGEGDTLRWVSIVTSGHAKTIRHSAAGKLMILHISGPGDVLDGLGCSPRSTHSVEARALRHCRIFSWDVRRFDSLSARFPALGRNSMRLLRSRSRMLEGRVHELATDRVPQRLAKILLRLIVQGQGSVRGPGIDLTGEDLAQMAGTTQGTVSRLLCDWAAQRIIQPERTAILVENLPGLIAIAMRVDCIE
jgi:CRP-like cAMP-binding protein